MNSYTLSRQWFDFAFENGSKVKPIHGSIYFWLVELANRLGWPAEFGSPGSQCMAACGISSYNTYKKAFDELVNFGFIEVRRKSINQYSSCIIALSIINNPQYKALDKALEKHSTKHLQSTIQSTDSINKPLTNNLETNKLEDTPTPPIPLPSELRQNPTPPKPTITKEHLFRDSPYIDLAKFIDAFPKDYLLKNYPGVDLEYYYESVLDWSDAGRQKKVDWIATARGFMRRDKADNKLKMLNSQPVKKMVY